MSLKLALLLTALAKWGRPLACGGLPGRPTPADYAEIVNKTLFAPDRNPNPIVEPTPEEPVPPFPIAHGVLALGETITVLLSEKANGPQKGYRVNDKVGPFRLAALTRESITVEWNGRTFVKALSELKATIHAEPVQPAAPVHRILIDHPITQGGDLIDLQNKGSEGNPGIDTGAAALSCRPGDTTPAGTVVNGYRKVVTRWMFGPNCRWEPIAH